MMITTYLNWLEQRGQVYLPYADEVRKSFVYKGSEEATLLFFLLSTQEDTLFTNEEERSLFIKVASALQRPWKQVGVYGLSDVTALPDLLEQTKHKDQVVLMPASLHPKDKGSAVWVWDLATMLLEPSAKKQTWQVLREKFFNQSPLL